MTTKNLFSAAIAIASIAAVSQDVTIDTACFRLVIGADAKAKSLIVKSTGEECLDVREGISMFSTTQERPFNNETKLAWPNKRTTYQANRLRMDEKGRLVAGFEIAPYEAVIGVKKGDGYLAFTLEDFNCVADLQYSWLRMDVPPVAEFRVLQLPVKNRSKFGDWLNVSWDDHAAVAVVGADPYVSADHADRHGFRLLNADLRRGLRLKGGTAAIVCGAGEKDFLDSMDGFERDFNLPRGVQNRRSEKLNRSICWIFDVTPKTVDEYIAMAKKGGFTMMLIYYPAIVKTNGYRLLGDYDWRPEYPNGEEDLKAMLAKIKAAGITPGFHTLQTHIGVLSRYVTPVLDPRLNKTRRFTLAKAIPAQGEVPEIFVEENPVDAMMYPSARVLGFGGEAFCYEAYTTEPPYRFTGVKRCHYSTRAAAHPHGEIGGTLDVSEFASQSIYIDQNTSLQDEIALKIKKIYDCGFEFCYFDGSEGVNPPCGINVALSQYRVTKTFAKPPIFTEGAAKSHFGWHLQAGANAFDTFPPEIFKAMIVKHPQAEAPIMRQDMTRVDFGWWRISPPGKKTVDRSKVPYVTYATIGSQPDMLEFGTSRAAAWDCPATLKLERFYPRLVPRFDDMMEVMRRWEDVRMKNWLTPAQKEALKSSTTEHHLYVNENGEYELHEIEMLPAAAKAPNLRGFMFDRGGRRVVAYWHMSGTGKVMVSDEPGEPGEVFEIGNLRYYETDLQRDDIRRIVSAATDVKD